MKRFCSARTEIRVQLFMVPKAEFGASKSLPIVKISQSKEKQCGSESKSLFLGLETLGFFGRLKRSAQTLLNLSEFVFQSLKPVLKLSIGSSLLVNELLDFGCDLGNVLFNGRQFVEFIAKK